MRGIERNMCGVVGFERRSRREARNEKGEEKELESRMKKNDSLHIHN